MCVCVCNRMKLRITKKERTEGFKVRSVSSILLVSFFFLWDWLVVEGGEEKKNCTELLYQDWVFLFYLWFSFPFFPALQPSLISPTAKAPILNNL